MEADYHTLKPIPVPVLLKSLNGLLFRPKSWKSSLILFFQILIQSIATPVIFIFRPTLDPTSLHPFYRTHPNLSPHGLAYCSQLLSLFPLLPQSLFSSIWSQDHVAPLCSATSSGSHLAQKIGQHPFHGLLALGYFSGHSSKLPPSPLQKGVLPPCCSSRLYVPQKSYLCSSFCLDRALPTHSWGLFLHFNQFLLEWHLSGQKALYCPIWHLVPLNPLTLLYFSSYHLSLLDHILSMYWFTYLSSVSFSRI